MTKKILLHICCGPCAVGPVHALREAGWEVHGYYFNPNIHPFQEWLRRRGAVEEVSRQLNLPVIFDDTYPLEDFLRRVVYREEDRCRICYAWRLEGTAAVARRGKFPSFTTTLLASHQQDHDLLSELGRTAGKVRGVRFEDIDFRPWKKRYAAAAREMGLYHQQYCGCVYSEKDRYLGKRTRWRPGKKAKPTD